MRPRRIVALFIVASPLALGGQRALAAQGRGAPDPGAAPKQSTYQLIDRALEDKQIDAETAHKYRVFAAFGDSRLPVQYRGTNVEPEPPPEVERVGSLLDTFSAQTRAELAPFFVRPNEPGSWITLGTVSDQQPGPGAPPPPDGERGLTPAHGASTARFAGFTAARGRSFRSRGSARTASVAAPIVWQQFTAASGKAKVWAQDRYPGDAAKAQALANALTTLIWNKLTTLMKREPVSDGAFASNGGDGALDFYLVHAPTEVDPQTGKRGFAWSGIAKSSDFKTGCHASRYLLIHSGLPLVGSPSTPGILSVAAHELFHAIEGAYLSTPDCLASTWIGESSATWADNFVYPDPNTEHDLAKAYLEMPHRPIDSYAQLNHKYGAYLLHYLREKTGVGQPDFMRQMWESFDQMGASLGAPPPGYANALQHIKNEALLIRRGVNSVLEGGFEETWPRFLAQIWNLPPVDMPNGYKRWDKLTHSAKFGEGALFHFVDASARIDETKIMFPMSASTDPADGGKNTNNLPYLSGYFSHFTFSSSVRTVVFVNTIADMGQPHTSVWGIVKIKGQWKEPKPWTHDFQKAWCRDDPNEDIEELVIVFGNSDWETMRQLTPKTPPTVTGYPTGCTGWFGSLTTTLTMESNGGAVTHVEKANATMRFEIDSAYIIPGQPREYWKVTSGNIWWTATVTGECTGGGQGSLPITYRGRGADQATLRVFIERDTLRYSGAAGPWPVDNPRYPVICPDKPPGESLLWITGFWYATDLKNNKVTGNGKSIIGAYTVRNTGTGGTHTIKYEYTFRLSP